MKLLTRVLLATLLAVPLAASAQEAPPTQTDAPKAETPKQKERLTSDELQVLAHYHMVNQMEIDLGKAAQKRARSQAVRAYGEMMVKDHTASDKKLRELAKRSGQRIPALKPATEAEKQEHAMAKKQAAELKKLEGADFEREYLRMMVADHERELAKIDANLAKVQHTELADMLREKKPVLQKHADEARELQKTNAQAMR